MRTIGMNLHVFGLAAPVLSDLCRLIRKGRNNAGSYNYVI